MDPDGPALRFDALADDDRFVRRLARVLVGPNDAEDVAQDAWLRTLQKADDASRSARPWLATVVRRPAFDFGRGLRRRRRREGAAARPEAVSTPFRVGRVRRPWPAAVRRRYPDHPRRPTTVRPRPRNLSAANGHKAWSDEADVGEQLRTPLGT
jgi:DNA-directed RNA polymerase specialized sigma24 family protein